MNTSHHHSDARHSLMKIYDWYNGPYPARVRIALAEKGLLPKVDFVSINLWKGEHKTPEFLEINYSGTLPVLELEDGTRIAECTAITQYLDDLDGSPTLTGKTAVEKGLIHMMTKRAEIEFLDAVACTFTMAPRAWARTSSSIRMRNGACACATRRYEACAISMKY